MRLIEGGGAACSACSRPRIRITIARFSSRRWRACFHCFPYCSSRQVGGGCYSEEKWQREADPAESILKETPIKIGYSLVWLMLVTRSFERPTDR